MKRNNPLACEQFSSGPQEGGVHKDVEPHSLVLLASVVYKSTTRPSVQLFFLGAVLLCSVSLAAVAVVAMRRPSTIVLNCAAPPGSTSLPDLVFFVVGDWGNKGSKAQRRVSEQMGRLAAQCYGNKISFVVSTGDNFYTRGISSLDDPLFKRSFSEVYTAKGLQVPWFAVLGNHDYGDDGSNASALVKGGYSPLWQVTSGATGVMARNGTIASRDPRWNCKQGAWRQSFASHLLDIIFIDTTPFQTTKRGSYWNAIPGGAGLQNLTEQVQVIEDLLKTSTARFKVVVGHHPRFSLGLYCNYNVTSGDCAAMSILEPIFTKYKVDAYFSGHDHNLQFFERSQDNNSSAQTVFYVISGAGSSARHGALQKIPAHLLDNDKAWIHENSGFTSVSIKWDSMTIDFWDVSHSSRVHSVRKSVSN